MCLYFVVRKDLNLSVVGWYQRGEGVLARRVQVRHLLVSMLCRVRSACMWFLFVFCMTYRWFPAQYPRHPHWQPPPRSVGGCQVLRMVQAVFPYRSFELICCGSSSHSSCLAGGCAFALLFHLPRSSVGSVVLCPCIGCWHCRSRQEAEIVPPGLFGPVRP